MADTESDVTYCSEVEKGNLSQRRRSQRLSEKLRHSFRSNEDPASQRFEDIHQMLKSSTHCIGWSKQDWLALRFELGLIKKSLKEISRSRLMFVEKKIDRNLRKSGDTSNSNISPELAYEDVTREPVKSPNILAGMTTEVLTELPPYQPPSMSNIMKTVQKSVASISVTQVNPLDLTKKAIEVPPVICFQGESIQMANALEPKLNENEKNLEPRATDTSKDSMIDLTDDIAVEANREIPALVIEEKPTSTKNAVHTSKWLKYLPTQEKPKALCEKPKASSPLKAKPKSFKQSLIKLYKDNSTSVTNIPSRPKKSSASRSPSKLKTVAKPSKPRCKENSKQSHLPHTQGNFGRDFELADVEPRHVQSERISSLSPDFFVDDFIQLDLQELNDNDSVTSLPFSLKASFKKVFGTDSLNDVLGCEKVVYSLTDHHVSRLASALNVKHDSLKRTIERILADDRDVNCTLFVDDMRSGGSSVIECSQSPPHRLFPSQRSQISK